ncbi:short-chain dehydrogenase/reductase SDR [Rubellimicrobium mesophilum DSM 19309]|uniref:Short-chain dehydrogenase/reductase SDR n=1 Tax=Rubellimicrobium mesophilum DSM 19309 TaxID=442562 RepID=A0A017HN56_9RHOB|nr:SDR family oxidoreductase [Rubellimicrobium mesophilum]EYD75219.1 short-chain dehydrogenase/reductase SDR [Rubellimicrobium mesophilum DSM 19309]
MPDPDDPFDEAPRGPGCGKLRGKTAFVTGASSGIGRATALLFAREGARVAISYYSDPQDAEETLRRMREFGVEGVSVGMDAGVHGENTRATREAIERLGGSLDILVCNASMQIVQEDVLDVSPEQARDTLLVNALGYLWTIQAALPSMRAGSCIVGTVSVVAYKGNEQLVDYAMGKGAELALLRSLAAQLAPKGIRVNAVAPGPVWTPFIKETMDEEKIRSFGKDVPLGRPAQAHELAPAYLFLASDDATYVTGQTIHVNGGMPVAS